MSFNIPQTQRAWLAINRGAPGPSTLQLRTDVPVPSKLAAKEVLVKVEAAAMNPLGYKLLKMVPNFVAKRPLVPEHDFSGIIVDGNSTEFKSGDPVFGWFDIGLNINSKQGALQQYLRVPTDYITRRPANFSAAEASLALVVLTAWHGLFDDGKLEAGQTVLINGGSSSVGAFAIQLAKAHGARVVATASGKNEELVRSLGADEFIDYTKQPLHSFLLSQPSSPKFHLIFDAVGLIDPSLYKHSDAYLAPGGIYVHTGPTPEFKLRSLWLVIRTFSLVLLPSWLGGAKRSWKIINFANDRARLDEIAKLMSEGKLKPIIDSVYPFADLFKAYERIMSSRARGKVVIDVTTA